MTPMEQFELILFRTIARFENTGAVFTLWAFVKALLEETQRYNKEQNK